MQVHTEICRDKAIHMDDLWYLEVFNYISFITDVDLSTLKESRNLLLEFISYC